MIDKFFAELNYSRVEAICHLRLFCSGPRLEEKEEKFEMSPETALRFGEWVNKNKGRIEEKIKKQRDSEIEWALERAEEMKKLAKTLKEDK